MCLFMCVCFNFHLADRHSNVTAIVIVNELLAVGWARQKGPGIENETQKAKHVGDKVHVVK